MCVWFGTKNLSEADDETTFSSTNYLSSSFRLALKSRKGSYNSLGKSALLNHRKSSSKFVLHRKSSSSLSSTYESWIFVISHVRLRTVKIIIKKQAWNKAYVGIQKILGFLIGFGWETQIQEFQFIFQNHIYSFCIFKFNNSVELTFLKENVLKI